MKKILSTARRLSRSQSPAPLHYEQVGVLTNSQIQSLQSLLPKECLAVLSTLLNQPALELFINGSLVTHILKGGDAPNDFDFCVKGLPPGTFSRRSPKAPIWEWDNQYVWGLVSGMFPKAVFQAPRENRDPNALYIHCKSVTEHWALYTFHVPGMDKPLEIKFFNTENPGNVGGHSEDLYHINITSFVKGLVEKPPAVVHAGPMSVTADTVFQAEKTAVCSTPVTVLKTDPMIINEDKLFRAISWKMKGYTLLAEQERCIFLGWFHSILDKPQPGAALHRWIDHQIQAHFQHHPEKKAAYLGHLLNLFLSFKNDIKPLLIQIDESGFDSIIHLFKRIFRQESIHITLPHNAAYSPFQITKTAADILQNLFTDSPQELETMIAARNNDLQTQANLIQLFYSEQNNEPVFTLAGKHMDLRMQVTPPSLNESIAQTARLVTALRSQQIPETDYAYLLLAHQLLIGMETHSFGAKERVCHAHIHALDPNTTWSRETALPVFTRVSALLKQHPSTEAAQLTEQMSSLIAELTKPKDTVVVVEPQTVAEQLQKSVEDWTRGPKTEATFQQCVRLLGLSPDKETLALLHDMCKNHLDFFRTVKHEFVRLFMLVEACGLPMESIRPLLHLYVSVQSDEPLNPQTCLLVLKTEDPDLITKALPKWTGLTVLQQQALLVDRFSESQLLFEACAAVYQSRGTDKKAWATVTLEVLLTTNTVPSHFTDAALPLCNACLKTWLELGSQHPLKTKNLPAIIRLAYHYAQYESEDVGLLSETQAQIVGLCCSKTALFSKDPLYKALELYAVYSPVSFTEAHVTVFLTQFNTLLAEQTKDLDRLVLFRKNSAGLIYHIAQLLTRNPEMLEKATETQVLDTARSLLHTLPLMMKHAEATDVDNLKTMVDCLFSMEGTPLLEGQIRECWARLQPFKATRPDVLIYFKAQVSESLLAPKKVQAITNPQEATDMIEHWQQEENPAQRLKMEKVIWTFLTLPVTNASSPTLPQEYPPAVVRFCTTSTPEKISIERRIQYHRLLQAMKKTNPSLQIAELLMDSLHHLPTDSWKEALTLWITDIHPHLEKKAKDKAEKNITRFLIRMNAGSYSGQDLMDVRHITQSLPLSKTSRLTVVGLLVFKYGSISQQDKLFGNVSRNWFHHLNTKTPLSHDEGIAFLTYIDTQLGHDPALKYAAFEWLFVHCDMNGNNDLSQNVKWFRDYMFEHYIEKQDFLSLDWGNMRPFPGVFTYMKGYVLYYLDWSVRGVDAHPSCFYQHELNQFMLVSTTALIANSPQNRALLSTSFNTILGQLVRFKRYLDLSEPFRTLDELKKFYTTKRNMEAKSARQYAFMTLYLVSKTCLEAITLLINFGALSKNKAINTDRYVQYFLSILEQVLGEMLAAKSLANLEFGLLANQLEQAISGLSSRSGKQKHPPILARLIAIHASISGV